ncbi:MAG: hydrolase [Deltaproteobacteria bacterium]|nr:hydrolase [Deltaproteobacteria bacterium]
MPAVRLERSRAALLVVDVQERLAAVMPQDALAAMVRNVRVLVEGAKVLGLPIVVTEQYPKGLGPTLADLRVALPGTAPVLPKTSFSCCGAGDVMAALDATGRDQWVVAGIEAHVCVFQTARDLAERGRAVHVAADAVLSRTPANLDAGLRLMERSGAILTSTEAVLFDLLGQAGSPEFKTISGLVK